MNIIIPAYPANLPKQLGAEAWYDSTRHGTLVTGNKVLSWTDLTGNGHHLLQSVDSARPVWTDNKQHGRPALVFTRANVSVLKTGSNWNGNYEMSIMSVALQNDLGNKAVIAGIGISGNALRAALTFSTAAKLAGEQYTSGSAHTNTTSAVYNNVPVIGLATIKSNLGGGLSRVPKTIGNGVDSSTPFTGGVLSTPTLNGGLLSAGSGYGLYTLSGWIAELAVWNRLITAAEYGRVFMAWSQKWGIKLA